METNLVVVCAVAFLAVLVLLSTLAVAIHLLSVFFPEKEEETDTAAIAAIHSAVSKTLPGSKVTQIEEI